MLGADQGREQDVSSELTQLAMIRRVSVQSPRQKYQELIAKGEFQEDPAQAREFLTQKSLDACTETTQAYWALGDLLWTKYDEKW